MVNNAIEQLHKVSKEVSILRTNLNKINQEKESYYKKKEELRRNISSLIKKLKDVKKDKDKSNKNIQELKKQRQAHREELKNLITLIKEIRKQKSELSKKFDTKIDPNSIKFRIEKLQLKIETEINSFEKEQKVMKEIKQLQKLYEETKDLRELNEKIKQISEHIDFSKSKLDEINEKIKAQINVDKDYKEFIELSKKIDDLKKEKELVFTKFLELKNQFKINNETFKTKLNELNDIRSKLDEINKNRISEKKKIIHEKISEKTKAIEEKIKNRQKLTNEDLLVFQESINS